MNTKFILGTLDPTVGTLAKSQNAKIDEMDGQCDNCLVEYCCKSFDRFFYLEKKHRPMSCPECGKRANTKCSYKTCQKCYTAHVLEGNGVACKTKVHAASIFDCKFMRDESPFIIDTVGVMDGNSESDTSLAFDASFASDVTSEEFPTYSLNATAKSAASDVMGIVLPATVYQPLIDDVYATLPALPDFVPFTDATSNLESDASASDLTDIDCLVDALSLLTWTAFPNGSNKRN